MDTRIQVIGKRNSLLNQIMYELRDQKVQQDRLRFRNNMEKAGELLAYEISRELDYESQLVQTPLGELNMPLLEAQPLIVSILRAGLSLHQGFLRMFDRADNGFISAFRHHTKGNKFIVKVEYSAVPETLDRDIILIDPMIATGKSMVLAAEELLKLGRPRRLFLAGVVASEDGLAYISRKIPQARTFVVAVDEEMTARGYIVPGLGDAGDLAFGPK
jgi:uracil phosphoribosyltransferase